MDGTGLEGETRSGSQRQRDRHGRGVKSDARVGTSEQDAAARARLDQEAVQAQVQRLTEELARVREKLRQTELRYRSMLENAVEGLFQSTPDGRFLAANAALARLLGYASPQELVATVRDIEREMYVDPGRRGELKRLLEEQGWVRDFQYQIRRKDGSVLWISKNARAVRDASGAVKHYEGTIVDITARKEAEEELRRINRALTILHACDKAALHATDEQGLLRQVCEIVVGLGGYRIAWVGLLEQDEAKTVRPVASAGCPDDCLSAIRLTWGETEAGCRLPALAIRMGRPVVARSLSGGPHFASCWDEALRARCSCCVVMPLMVGGEPYGILDIYAAEERAFGDAEVEFLAQLAGDVGDDISALRTLSARQRSHEEAIRLRAALEQLATERSEPL